MDILLHLTILENSFFDLLMILLSSVHCFISMSIQHSVHRGSKVVLSLCVCRLPSRYVEPEFAKNFRQWRQDWEERTNNRLNIADGLTYLKTPGHFLPSIEERQRLQRLGTDDSSDHSPLKKSHANEIDELLASEGIPELENLIADSEANARADKSQGNVRKDNRAQFDSESLLWLIVRYKANPSVWTMPFANRRGTESAFDTLKRISVEQMGIKPHFPSLSPVGFRKLRSADDTEPSTRLFYYKGVFIPKSHDVRLSPDVLDHMWVSRDQLQAKLTRASWITLQDALPLD